MFFASPNENRILLNMGGIANLTFLPKNGDTGAVFSSDIGPGNTIMDALAKEHSGQRYDKDANIAKSGTVNPTLLKRLLEHPFVNLVLPKTTGPETFNISWFKSQLALLNGHNLSIPDQMATLNAFTAHTIVNTINKLTTQTAVYISGGGSHNPLLRQNIELLLNRKVHLSDALGVNADAKEAILFAVLANECISGTANTFNGNNLNQPNISMGKISLP